MTAPTMEYFSIVRKEKKEMEDLAWYINRIPWAKDDDRKELRIKVNLDAEEDKKPGAGKPNMHRIVIKETSNIDFASLTVYLVPKADFNNTCLQAVTSMDHLLRKAPRKDFTQIKYSFARGQKRFDLSSGAEASKGVYQSLCIAHAPGGVGCLTCNVDVSNGTFFAGGDMGKCRRPCCRSLIVSWRTMYRIIVVIFIVEIVATIVIVLVDSFIQKSTFFKPSSIVNELATMGALPSSVEP